MINLLATEAQAGNFSDYSAWGFLNVIAVLVISLLLANLLKRRVGFIRKSLIPTSVLGGLILLAVSFVYTCFAGKDASGDYKNIFNLPYFGGNGLRILYLIAYHALALGFIASTLKSANRGESTKERTRDIFNTGVQTVATYLVQAVLGMGLTLVFAATILPELFPVSGLLLPFGYGQGTGQALNWGNTYEQTYGFAGGANFGLTVAALGFLSASVGGIIYLNILKRKGKIKVVDTSERPLLPEDVQGENEMGLNESIDKLSIQVAFVLGAYVIANLIMWGLSKLAPGLSTTLYGFNFLFGVLAAVLIKSVIKLLKKCGALKRNYINNFLMDRIMGFSFDLMILAGFAAIEIQLLYQYWYVLLILAVVGALSTYFYTMFVSRTLFKGYKDEQFMAMYGMLTGTASTGMMLLREVDNKCETPVASNLVYQNFPAIIFGFPLMLLASLAPEKPVLTLLILVGMFVVLNVILFRRQIFCRKKDKKAEQSDSKD